ncbi:MAG TPA: ABC transporter permease [Bryobacteraceae bacterium]|nr:ABC transporter permease [Bryobacteraceae bacterium]
MGTLTQDVRYALRTLARSPLFCAVAVASLALGIGANTAIFTLINQLLLKLLPVKDPQALVMLDERGDHYGNNTGMNSFSYLMYTDLRDQNRVFSGMFCRYGQPLSFSSEGRTERISGELVSGNYFPVLGVGAAAGRVFTAADDQLQGGHPVAVISYDFWQSHFGGEPDAIGRKVLVNGYPLTIIGVSQRGFYGIDPSVSPEIRIPMSMKAQMTPGPWYSLNDRRSRFAQVFGRLKPGVSLQQAKAGLQPLYHSILEKEVREKEFDKASAYTRQTFLKGWVNVLPASKGRSNFRDQYSNPLLVLMAVVGFVLLIACANLANLLIARAASRGKEMAMRVALGASRFRVVRQLLVESLVLALAGGVLGLLLAVGMNRALMSFVPTGTTPLALSASPDWRVFGFNIGISFLTGILFGFVPALHASRPDIVTTLKDQAGAVVGGGSVGLRKVLVAAQVALSLLLLIGAGLFVKTLRNLRDTDPGFRVDNLITFKVDPPRNGYSEPRARQFYRDLTERLSGAPGVTHASMTVVPLLDGDEWDSTITVEGYNTKPGEDMNPHMNYPEPGLFATLGVPILLGRDFNDNDEMKGPKVAIVNAKFVQRYLKGMNPIGHHLGMGGNPGTKTDITIVGVVRNTKYEDMRADVPVELYLPARQSEFVVDMTAYVRTSRPADQAMGEIRSIVRGMDANLPIYDIRTLNVQMDRSLSIERLVASLSAVFGALATFLAAIGLYGVMAFMVTRRTREIGIRMALGAKRGDVLWLVMREVLILMLVGIAIGVPASYLLTRLVQTQLYGVGAHDPLTMVAAVLGIAAVAALAGYAPGRRATLVHPMEALRCE